MPATWPNVSARAIPIDTTVAAITSETISATVVVVSNASSANLRRLCDRSIESLVNISISCGVRIALLTDMAADAGAGSAGLGRRL